MRTREVTRTLLEQVAKIVGPDSAAAKALADAETHDGPVRFYERSDRVLIVEKLPKEGT